MSKIVIKVPFQGDVYRIHSEPLSRSIFMWLAKTKIATTEDDEEVFNTIAKEAQAEWQLNDGVWNSDKWEKLPPAVGNAWLEKIITICGTKVEAQVESEKN